MECGFDASVLEGWENASVGVQDSWTVAVDSWDSWTVAVDSWTIAEEIWNGTVYTNDPCNRTGVCDNQDT